MSMKLIHMKLKTGDDIVGYAGESTPTSVEIITPVQISIDPVIGIFAKNWLIFSDINRISIDRELIMFVAGASEKASDYYDELIHRFHEQSKPIAEDDTEFTNELEDIFTAMMESKESIKH